jgi:hypothetical protein
MTRITGDEREAFSILHMDSAEAERLNDVAITETAADIADGEKEKIDLEAVVAELAKLSPLEFDQVLKDRAVYLGVRATVLASES